MFRWSKERGEGSEFENVALVHLDTLYRGALRLTHNRADAEDLVQETYLRALRSFHRFNPGTNCRAWLLTILRNAFLNRVRRGAREVPDGDLSSGERGFEGVTELVVGTDDPEDEFFQTVLHGDVDRALKTLPLAFREAVVLADLEGLRYKEVAEVLECPIGTVMSRLSRGRHLLRRSLTRLAREHGYSKESQ